MHAEIPNVIALSSGDNPPGCDDPSQQLAPSETPGKGGYQVQTCKDSREALSLLEQNLERIDLVITDLQMPSLDGIELAAEILKINPNLPVVLTSAAMLRMPSEKLRFLGIRDFLPKPWDLGQLFSAIRQALASKQSKDETSED